MEDKAMAGQYTVSRDKLIAAQIEQIDKQDLESSAESSLWKAGEEAVQFKNRSTRERTEPILLDSKVLVFDASCDGFGMKSVHRYNGPTSTRDSTRGHRS